MKKTSGIQSGVSGEYFVAAELSRRGYMFSITLKNTKGIDVLVSNENSKKLAGVQVKTNNSNRKAWVLNKKAEELAEDNFIYVFTNLKELGQLPDYYIVPSQIVAKYVKKEHKEWLNTPGKNGQAHRENDMRMFRDENEEFKNKWEIFELLLG
jgi:hypothetical protein